MGFSFTNTTASGETVSPVVLDVVDNYAKLEDEPRKAQISNKTASMEQPEVITYRCDHTDKLSVGIPVRHPGLSRDGVQYTIKLETIWRDTAGTIPIDEPISAWLTIKHPVSDTWDNAKVSQIVKRLVSACLKGQASTGSGAVADADWRFEDLMRSALVPTVD